MEPILSRMMLFDVVGDAGDRQGVERLQTSCAFGIFGIFELARQRLIEPKERRVRSGLCDKRAV